MFLLDSRERDFAIFASHLYPKAILQNSDDPSSTKPVVASHSSLPQQPGKPSTMATAAPLKKPVGSQSSSPIATSVSPSSNNQPTTTTTTTTTVIPESVNTTVPEKITPHSSPSPPNTTTNKSQVFSPLSNSSESLLSSASVSKSQSKPDNVPEPSKDAKADTQKKTQLKRSPVEKEAPTDGFSRYANAVYKEANSDPKKVTSNKRHIAASKSPDYNNCSNWRKLSNTSPPKPKTSKVTEANDAFMMFKKQNQRRQEEEAKRKSRLELVAKQEKERQLRQKREREEEAAIDKARNEVDEVCKTEEVLPKQTPDQASAIEKLRQKEREDRRRKVRETIIDMDQQSEILATYEKFNIFSLEITHGTDGCNMILNFVGVIAINYICIMVVTSGRLPVEEPIRFVRNLGLNCICQVTKRGKPFFGGKWDLQEGDEFKFVYIGLRTATLCTLKNTLHYANKSRVEGPGKLEHL
ncbi:hypothetical protein GQR58_023530 [Nymphon striatum]|nr:hypothetical protein GQR58_023530 [Nymphon striatum]